MKTNDPGMKNIILHQAGETRANGGKVTASDCNKGESSVQMTIKLPPHLTASFAEALKEFQNSQTESQASGDSQNSQKSKKRDKKRKLTPSKKSSDKYSILENKLQQIFLNQNVFCKSSKKDKTYIIGENSEM